MAQCPVCQAEITADFGLVECESCQAQLIVHVDGSVEASGGPVGVSNDTGYIDEEENDFVATTDDEPSESAPNWNEAPPEQSQMEQNAEYGAEFEPRGETASRGGTSSGIRTSSAGRPVDYDTPLEEPAGDMNAVSEFTGDEGPAHEAPSDSFADMGGPEPEVYRPVQTSDSPDLSDVAQFGNSDISSHREGALRYNLHVSGIDTIDTRNDFREALTDRKFVWDVDRILRSIRNGEVVIADVSAVKAYMLISRLRSLPVRVRWEQYAIHQA